MNTYKDLQVETRRRNERRDQRKAFFAAIQRINGQRALGQAHLEPGQLEGHSGFGTAYDRSRAVKSNSSTRHRAYPREREATSWVSIGRRGRARRLHYARGISYSQAVRQVSK